VCVTTGAKETYYSVKEKYYSVKMSRPTTVAKLLKEKKESKNVSERDARTHAHAHTCTRAHMHTRTHAHAHTCTRAHMHTRTHVRWTFCHSKTLKHSLFKQCVFNTDTFSMTGSHFSKNVSSSCQVCRAIKETDYRGKRDLL
jgi:hypothetical protein